MDNKQLDSLVKIGQLKKEPFSQSEDETYLRSGKERLGDAAMAGMSLSSKFLLGYGAAYSFSLAALRRRGYRPVNRYIVFQCLPHTLAVGPCSVNMSVAVRHCRPNKGIGAVSGMRTNSIVASACWGSC